MDLSTLSPIAIAAAALVSFLVGGLWYSPILFARPWMAATGLGEDELRGSAGRVFGIAFVLSVIIAANLAAFLGRGAGAAWGAGAGALAGVGWVAASVAITHLFERRPPVLILIDGGYQAVSYTLMGLVIGLLQ